MKQKTEIRMPIGGISKSSARGKQRPATTPDALNVRGLDPRTGRVRVSRRAGTIDVVSEPFRGGQFNTPQPIRWGHVGQYFQPTDDLSLLAGEDWVEEWSEPLLADGIAITVGFDGRIYVLDETGRVIILDDSGTKVGYVASPIPSGMTPLRRILTDESGAVYVAGSGTISIGGRASAIYRITQPAQEGDRLSVSWEHPIEGKLVDFTVRSGTLSYLYDTIDGEIDGTYVAYLGALESGLPIEYASGETAIGAWRIEMNRFGDAIIAAPRDDRRGSAVFDAPSVSWTPRELTDWEDKLFFWIDAAQVREDGTNWVNDDPVTEIPDVRHFEHDLGVTNDTVERKLLEYSGFSYSNARVTWNNSAFGLSPAFVINRGGMLRTEPSTSGALTDQQSIFPVDGADGAWSAFFTLQVPSGTGGGERVLTQYAGTGRWAIRIRSSSGNITVDLGTTGGAAYDLNIASSPSAPTGFNSMALIRIDYDPAGAGPMTVFINGNTISSQNVGSLAAWGSWTANGSTHDNPITTFGAGVDFESDHLVVTSTEDWPNPGTGSAGAVIQVGDTIAGDLGSNKEVAGMELRSLDTGFRNATMFRVEAATISDFSTLVFSQVFQKESGSFQGIYRFLFSEVFDARYIRIVLLESLDTSGTGTWRINEARLYTSVDEGATTQGSLIHLHEAIVYRGALSAGDALKLEGYLAWKVGGGSFLIDDAIGTPGSHTYAAAPPVGLADVELPLLVLAQVATSAAMVVKHDTTAALVAVATEERIGGGVGYGLAIDEDDAVYSCGAPFAPVSNSGPTYVKLIDAGTQFTASGGFILRATNSEYQPILDAGKPVTMGVDSAGFVSRALPDGRLVRTSKGGDLKSVRAIDSFPWAFAFPSFSPQYGSSPNCGPEFIYALEDRTLDKLRMVKRTPSGRLSARQTRFLTVAGDTLFTFDGLSPATTPEGTGTFSNYADTIFGETVFGETIIVDGKRIRVVDLGKNTSSEFEVKKGPVPDRTVKLIALWDGRLVFARSESDPHNWYMSARGDVRDFDEYPADGADSRAVSGNSSVLDGRMPSVINTIIPVNDNILVFGCAGAIYRLIGNPAGGGGRFTMSETIGMAFGKSWCRDSRGTLYFMSDTGGIYVMGSQADSVPFGGPENLSLGALHDEMQEIDFSRYRVHLEWSEEQNGMHIFLIPLDRFELVEQPIHYFFEIRVAGEKGGSWWKDQFSHRNHQLTAVWRSEGDAPEDRVVMLGSRDGMIRQFSSLAVSDAGHPIPSHFVVGPFPGTMEGVEVLASGLEVSLATEGGSMLCGMYGSRSESIPGRPTATVELTPGLNPPSLARARGNHLWFRFEGNENSPWSVEAAWIRVGAAGEARAR